MPIHSFESATFYYGNLNSDDDFYFTDLDSKIVHHLAFPGYSLDNLTCYFFSSAAAYFLGTPLSNSRLSYLLQIVS